MSYNTFFNRYLVGAGKNVTRPIQNVIGVESTRKGKNYPNTYKHNTKLSLSYQIKPTEVLTFQK